MAEGRIVKALSGFYYVKSGNKVYQCRGRGVFRKNKITPLVGDFVKFDISDEKEGYVIEVEKRKNELVRPPIANIDQAIIVSSAVKPDFSTRLLDRFLVLIEARNIKPIIFITKLDLASPSLKKELESFREDYRRIGYDAELFSAKDVSQASGLHLYFPGKVSVIAGQSGVGKSSLLNTLEPSLVLQTGEISESLGRGKHTTRHVELVEVNGGLVADTPGFGSLELEGIELNDLGDCFPEIRQKSAACKFRGCSHNKEPKCAVKQAVEAKEIPLYRYEHYLRFYEEIQLRKPRY
ncbi:ribosome small subunit-dependent GTPase A [Virgibacillus kimchii]